MPGLRAMPEVMTTISEFCGLVIAVRADDERVVAQHWTRFEDVQRLALRHIRHDIHQHHIGIVALGDALAQRRAHVPGSDDGYFAAHLAFPSFARRATTLGSAALWWLKYLALGELYQSPRDIVQRGRSRDEHNRSQRPWLGTHSHARMPWRSARWSDTDIVQAERQPSGKRVVVLRASWRTRTCA